MEFVYADRRHEGSGKTTGRDHVFIDDRHQFFLVVNGFGPEQNGQKMVEMFFDAFHPSLTSDLKSDTPVFIKESVRDANKRIFSVNEDFGASKRSGCSYALAKFEEKSISISHIGDCRAYLFRRGKLKQLTEDHRVLLKRTDRDSVAPDSSKASALTRYAGKQPGVVVELLSCAYKPGDILLLSTSNFNQAVSEGQIEQILSNLNSDIDSMADDLLNAAFEKRGSTEMAFLLVRVPGHTPLSLLTGPMTMLGGSIIFSIVLLGLIYAVLTKSPQDRVVATAPATPSPTTTPMKVVATAPSVETGTPTRLASATATDGINTLTLTPTSIPTGTRTYTYTPSFTPDQQLMATAISPSDTPTESPDMATDTPTVTPSPSATDTPTLLPSPTVTDTPSPTKSPTPTPTPTREKPTPSDTPTRSNTPTATPTVTYTPTYTASATNTPSPTIRLLTQEDVIDAQGALSSAVKRKKLDTLASNSSYILEINPEIIRACKLYDCSLTWNEEMEFKETSAEAGGMFRTNDGSTVQVKLKVTMNNNGKLILNLVTD